jgi:hypothetical protein
MRKFLGYFFPQFQLCINFYKIWLADILDNFFSQTHLVTPFSTIGSRHVRKSEGIQLARAYSTLFGEVSAADGRNVEHSITELAKLLAERQVGKG